MGEGMEGEYFVVLRFTMKGFGFYGNKTCEKETNVGF